MHSNESSTRTREIEEFTNLHFIHPVGARLTPLLARLQVSPNAVSLSGMACGMLAGWAYHRYEDVRYACLGFLLMVVWLVLDGVDGQLARLTNRQSEFGRIIDGIADNVTFVSVYLGLGLALAPDHGPWVWALLALAGTAHSMQAATYELQRQEYDFWGWGKKSAEFKSVEALRREQQPRSLLQQSVYSLGQSYARWQFRVSGVDPDYRRKVAAALVAQPDRAPQIRERYRQTFARLVRTWSIMSSNYRTLAIFVCTLTGVPLLYFVIELLVLTPLTLLLIRQQKSRSREFSRLLDRQVP